LKRQKIDTSTEQKIITAMVVDDEFLGQVQTSLDVELIRAPHLQKIAKWCQRYHEKYRKAPRQNIESIYHSWVRKGKAKEEVMDAVHDVLEHLSELYEETPDLNVPYLLDVASKYFNMRRIEVLRDDLDYSLTEGDETAAQEAITNFATVDSGLDLGIDPFNNELAWDAAFAESQQPLIDWKDKAANKFFGTALGRDSLVAVLAPEKRGKTWWCIEFVVRALMNRKRVALFEVGDMSQSQTLRRFGVRFSKRPMFQRDKGTIEVPRKIWKDEEGVHVTMREVECDKTCNAAIAKKSLHRFLRSNGLKRSVPYFKLSTHANSAINVHGINTVLDQWELYEGFIPDIIIIDYPDILAPEPGVSGQSTRDQINGTWKALRRLSQEKHACVIAPTQADAAAYLVETLNESNFSEDKRKAAHVTGMLGLNQTREEKNAGRMRLNWIFLRENEFSADLCLHVGQCLSLGRAFCCSTL